MDKSFESFVTQVETGINAFIPGDQPPELYEPIKYILSLGGKRLRPLLVLMSYGLFKGDTKQIIKPAISVEVFHNFTLMHDDIMDKAPLRRGYTTVHKRWNENIAILSGDVMLIKAYDLLMKAPVKYLQPTLKRFGVTAAEVCEGQQMDMNFEHRKDVTIKEYLEMIRLKTAVLIGYSLELGALLAGENPETCQELRQAGTNIGMGFQLMDDLLDVYADKNKFGKQVGGDILANKKTYLLIKALKTATGDSKASLLDWLKKKEYDPGEKISAITSIYDNLNIRDITNTAIFSYYRKGTEILQHMDVDPSIKKTLLAFIDRLLKREK